MDSFSDIAKSTTPSQVVVGLIVLFLTHLDRVYNVFPKIGGIKGLKETIISGKIPTTVDKTFAETTVQDSTNATTPTTESKQNETVPTTPATAVTAPAP